MTKPHIMITNDDGVLAPGIRHLRDALKDIAKITVVAPSQERSATSLSITIRDPLRVEQLQWSDNSSVWSVNGTPVDSVKMGLHLLKEDKPDLIVSGINRGTNSGRNILYSGTVACAIESVMHDIPSIAFSCYDHASPDFKFAEPYVPKIVEHVLEHALPTGTFLNVNFPPKLRTGIKGFKLTRQGQELWLENPDMRSHPFEGHTYYWLGGKLSRSEELEDSDVSWLKKGYATAVPVHVGELTDHDQLKQRKSAFEKLFEYI